MNVRLKIATTVLLGAAFGFMLNPNAPLGAMLWPAADHDAIFGTMTGGAMGLLMAYSVFAAIGFGFAIAFLLFGMPLVARTRVSPGLARGAHLAIVWVMGNWVIHDSLHMAATSYMALAGLEWGFHATMIVAGLVLARYFLATTGAWPSGAAAPAPADDAAPA